MKVLPSESLTGRAHWSEPQLDEPALQQGVGIGGMRDRSDPIIPPRLSLFRSSEVVQLTGQLHIWAIEPFRFPLFVRTHAYDDLSMILSERGSVGDPALGVAASI